MFVRVNVPGVTIICGVWNKREQPRVELERPHWVAKILSKLGLGLGVWPARLGENSLGQRNPLPENTHWIFSYTPLDTLRVLHLG